VANGLATEGFRVDEVDDEGIEQGVLHEIVGREKGRVPWLAMGYVARG
jgi:hypothetical protein